MTNSLDLNSKTASAIDAAPNDPAGDDEIVPTLAFGNSDASTHAKPGKCREDERQNSTVQVNDEEVNVTGAKQDFENLQRSFSRRSLQRSLSRRNTRLEATFDPEKGGDHGEEFDLLDFLVCSAPQCLLFIELIPGVWRPQYRYIDEPRDWEESQLRLQVQGSWCYMG